MTTSTKDSTPLPEPRKERAIEMAIRYGNDYAIRRFSKWLRHAAKQRRAELRSRKEST